MSLSSDQKLAARIDRVTAKVGRVLSADKKSADNIGRFLSMCVIGLSH